MLGRSVCSGAIRRAGSMLPSSNAVRLGAAAAPTVGPSPSLAAPLMARRNFDFVQKDVRGARKIEDVEPEREYQSSEDGTKVHADGLDYTGYVPQNQFEDTHAAKLRETFGEGNADLYRVLYRELCDEMRRERYVKPPPPSSHVGSFDVHHTPGSDYVVFDKKDTAGKAQVVIGAQLSLKDPKQINETLTFLNWYEIDVCVRREAYVLHFQMAVAEQQLYPRNWKAYHDPTGDMLKFDDPEVEFRRNFRKYDGPYYGHLELDHQSEMFDLLLDTGITSYATRYLAEWIFYLEHVEYVRWLTGMLETLIPEKHEGYIADAARAAVAQEDGNPGQAAESLLLSREERRDLDEEVEEWRPIIKK